jgi:hypothetical protein
VRRLARRAHTTEEFKTVADGYQTLEEFYNGKAEEERLEWIRRSQMPAMSIAAKFPRPVDSAHDLYQYYRKKADEMAKLLARYRQLAMEPQPATAMGAAVH